jgi:hypothetical protein
MDAKYITPEEMQAAMAEYWEVGEEMKHLERKIKNGFDF